MLHSHSFCITQVFIQAEYQGSFLQKPQKTLIVFLMDNYFCQKRFSEVLSVTILLVMWLDVDFEKFERFITIFLINFT